MVIIIITSPSPVTSHQQPGTQSGGCRVSCMRAERLSEAEGPEGGEGEELLKFSHYEIRQSEESRESLARGSQPPSLS